MFYSGSDCFSLVVRFVAAHPLVFTDDEVNPSISISSEGVYPHPSLGDVSRRMPKGKSNTKAAASSSSASALAPHVSNPVPMIPLPAVSVVLAMDALPEGEEIAEEVDLSDES